MRMTPILEATRLLMATVNDKLADSGKARVPIAREGETPSMAGTGGIYWDYTEEKPTDNTSEPAQAAAAQISNINVIPFTVYVAATDFTRRGELEKAVLDILTPVGDDNRRHPYGGWFTLDDTDGSVVEFHSVFHRGTVSVPGAKQGQDGPEVPVLLMNFTVQVEVTDPPE